MCEARRSATIEMSVPAKHGHEGASGSSFEIGGMEVEKLPPRACSRGWDHRRGCNIRVIHAVADMAQVAALPRRARDPGDRSQRPVQCPAGGGAAKDAASTRRA